jgi:hypothetical protein
LRHLRHRAEPATDVELEAALHLTIHDPLLGDDAEVVKVREATGVVLAAGEGDLELPAEVLGVVVTQQKYIIASAYGMTSKVSVWQTPAYGQAVMLRTELPQASREVTPTAARRRIKSGVSSMWMKWS